MALPCDIKGDDGAYHCPYDQEEVKHTSELCKEKCDADIAEDPCEEDENEVV